MGNKTHDFQYTAQRLDQILDKADHAPFVVWFDASINAHRFFPDVEKRDIWVDAYMRGTMTPEIAAFEFVDPIEVPEAASVDLAPLEQSINNLNSALLTKTPNTDFKTLQDLVYSLHSTPSHSSSPAVFFKTSNPTLLFDAALKVGGVNIDITSVPPTFTIGGAPYEFTKLPTSTSKVHKYSFVDGNHLIAEDVVVSYRYASALGIQYTGTVSYKAVSPIYFGKSVIETLNQVSAQELIGLLQMQSTPLAKAVTSLDIFNIPITQEEAQNPETAPYFYFAVPDDVVICSKFYLKGGSAQFAAPFVTQGNFLVHVEDVSGERTQNYRFIRSGARQGAGNHILYLV